MVLAYALENIHNIRNLIDVGNGTGIMVGCVSVALSHSICTPNKDIHTFIQNAHNHIAFQLNSVQLTMKRITVCAMQ